MARDATQASLRASYRVDGERLLTLGKFSLRAQAEAPIDDQGMNADAIENAVEEMIVT